MNDISSNVDLLARVLDAASLRHRVIAQNVANVNTPGYRALDVSFEAELVQCLARGDAGDAARLKAAVVERAGGPERADGNNVDIDQEMGRLNKNTLLYRTIATVLAVRLGALRSAITGR